MKSRGMPARQGDIIPYVICKTDDTSSGIGARAFHPEEVLRADSGLHIDIEWYLKQQVLPTVNRLCEPIDGMHTAQLAECLGLDPGKVAYSDLASAERERRALKAAMSEKEYFAAATRWTPTCPACGVSAPFEGPVAKADGVLSSALVCGCGQALAVSMQAQLAIAVRRDIQRYYEGRVKCDECGSGSAPYRFASVNDSRCIVLGCRGTLSQVFSDRKLHMQLKYYDYLFDAERQLSIQDPADALHAGEILMRHRAELAGIRAVVKRFLDVNKANFVDLATLFSLVKVA